MNKTDLDMAFEKVIIDKLNLKLEDNKQNIIEKIEIAI